MPDEKDPHAPGAMRDANLPETQIGSIHHRAQEVRPGGLFVAIEGLTADGHHYVDQALERGAVAIVAQKIIDPTFSNAGRAEPAEQRPLIIQVPDTRIALADLAARFYNYPSKHLTLIAITGTNGKTTVAYLIEGILSQAGFKVGVIGTINYRYADKTFSNPMTTPESLDLQKIMAEMRQQGVCHVIMEASSHAIDLNRIRNCWFDVAVFTNLSQDHLDFHGDMQSYWTSKKKLFTEYLQAGPKKEKAVAVVNCSDPKGQELANVLPMPVVKTGSAPDCEIKALSYQCTLNGTTGKVATLGGSFDFKTPLLGAHNVENILSATGVAAALNIAPPTIKVGIETTVSIPGRLERIENGTGRLICVDYAHTPDALENTVSAVKEIAPAKVICVFGCGGDRDKEKRPLMGKIVARLCDLSIVTSDNPRTEDPLAIISEILLGIRQSDGVEYSTRDLESGFDKKGYTVEPDRRCAIKLAIKISQPGDAVIIAGKGHESYQIIGQETIDFDDRVEAKAALNTAGGH
ncbi:MAG: UDP-N-acetylmuramoyl-L-alanyl-D-glutamate--2,6-diaminopimelate ligase [Desulfobacterales bacterium]|nr:UDP-N-acetylmuramoyl-L-alanyl-D-glutamate--2,6-diaminopimelate ligase [Desulfobacterales bacterium]